MRLQSGAASLLVLSLVLGPGRPSPRAQGAAQEDPSREVARIKVLVDEARWGDAMRAALDLSARCPDRPELHVLVGDTLLLNFRADEAAAQYRAALDAPVVAPLALGKLAGALVAQGKDGEALRVLRDGAAKGIALSDGALVLQAKLEPLPKDRVAIQSRLLKEHPDDEGLKGQLALALALAGRLQGPIEAASGALGTARVKEIYREPSVLLSLNGREDWLALDTGSESILLNVDTAKRLRLPVLAETEYLGWGDRGARKTAYVFVDRLEVAGRTLRGVAALLNRRDSEFSTNKAGYLSLGPFRDVTVRYDRRQGVFSLHPSGTDPSSLFRGQTQTLPILWARDLPLVPVMVAGRGPFPFLLDTGAIYTLLDTQHAAALGIRANTGKYGKLRAEGMSGAFTSNVAEQVTLGLGRTRYDRPAILVTDVPQRFLVPVFGILGRDILNDYAMAFDGPLATLTLARY
jgi:predicted aspartyl protease